MCVRDLYIYVGICIAVWTPIFALEGFTSNDVKGFDDDVLFKINWPGRSGDDLGVPDSPSEETLIVTTENNEKYKCLLPQLQKKEKDAFEVYTGPNPYQLLSPIFSDMSSCSYRLESYWTYELCHGKHVRQYHEEREGKKVKVQEFYLGKWDEEEAGILRQKLADEENIVKPRADIPVKKIDGLNMPYIQLNMTGGTMCDLIEQPRRTKVIYVCYPHGKHDIYTLKETSTCEYEVLVLSQLLCLHPKYKPLDSAENIVNCHPLDKTPKKPKNLIAMEAESLKLRHQKITDEKVQKVYAVFSVDKAVDGQEDQHRVRVEIHPVDLTDDTDTDTDTTTEASIPDLGTKDTTPVEGLLSGKSCLHGGAGWWKYELCYGRTVNQYHNDKDGTRTVINLGRFNKANHVEWLDQNPHKRPKPVALRKSISHFYSGGMICDKTGRPRQTEVKLKCLENNVSPTLVALFLIEPRPCEYILGVESPLLCDLLAQADEHGLLNLPGLGEFSDEMSVSLDDEDIIIDEDGDELDLSDPDNSNDDE